MGARALAARAHSAPARERHSLQIEINCALYMDEESLARHEGFEKLRATTTALAREIARSVRAKLKLNTP